MSTMSLDVTSVRPRRVLRLAAMIGGAAATAVVIGLLTAQSFSHAAIDAKPSANASLSQPVAVPELVASEIVPSPVIDTDAPIFIGTGDGSNGYYTERRVR
ncbi:MAG: hypothetical protein WAK63_10990 [Xanthobacteraceae bacterium]